MTYFRYAPDGRPFGRHLRGASLLEFTCDDASISPVSHSETNRGLEFSSAERLVGSEACVPGKDGSQMHDSVSERMSAIADNGEALPEAEMRGAPRFTVLIRAAKLINDRGEFLCVLRDASQTGLSVKLFHPLPSMDEVTLEFSNGDQYRLATVWQNEDKAGFRFAEEVDFERLLANRGEFSKRAIRVNVKLDGLVSLHGQKIEVEIQNISQQGAQIAADERFAIDQRLVLTGSELPEIEAKVRWRRDGSYGLIFEDTFQLSDMARIVAKIQHVRNPSENT